MSAAQRKARLVHAQFGDRIRRAVAKTYVPVELVAGIISGECAFDPKTQKYVESVPRFEKHVYAALVSLRDRGYYTTRQGARKTSYGRVTPGDLEGATDAAVRALASSWGPGQIMGYHAIDWNATIEDLRSPSTSVDYVVRMLMRDAGAYIKRGAWESVFRIWNTGSPTGKTYHPDYAANGIAVLRAYRDEFRDANGVDAPRPTWQTVGEIDSDTVPAEGARGHDEDPDARDPLAAGATAGGAGAGVTVAASTTGAVGAQAGPAPASADAQKVTSGSGSWARSVSTWIAALFGTASQYVRDAFGLSPEIQRWLLVGVAIFGVVWLVTKLLAERQIREIAADPDKVTVK